jgi:2,4-dienoyl-CoA reductase-like NADH-dependent reductase (Old Yellow Enzyme family)
MWDDGQIEGHKRLVRFLKQEGALAGTQITHAGRKGSTPRSFDKPGQLGPQDAGWQKWEVVGPSELSAAEGWQIPRQLGIDEIETLIRKFGEAARRADAAGYDVIEIHGAHGYLLAQFLSPISNTRNDQYGGDRAGRMRFPLDAARAVRAAWPVSKPMFIQGAEGTGRRCDRLFLGRPDRPVDGAAGQAFAGLPGAVRGGGQAAGGHPHHGRWPDPRRATGRGDPAGRRR